MSNPRDIPLKDRLKTMYYFDGKYYFKDKYFPDEWYYYDKSQSKMSRCAFENFSDVKELFTL